MKYITLVVFLALVGCAEPDPLVADFNGDSVKIQQSTALRGANADDPKVIAEANKICATRKRRAEYASTLMNAGNYTATHLFLCL